MQGSMNMIKWFKTFITDVSELIVLRERTKKQEKLLKQVVDDTVQACSYEIRHETWVAINAYLASESVMDEVRNLRKQYKK